MRVFHGTNNPRRDLFIEIADFIIVENDDFQQQEYQRNVDLPAFSYFYLIDQTIDEESLLNDMFMA